jgi:hypothetical protein
MWEKLLDMETFNNLKRLREKWDRVKDLNFR